MDEAPDPIAAPTPSPPSRRRVRLRHVLAALGVVLCGYAAYVAWRLPSHAEVRALARTNPRTTGVMRQREDEARAAHRKLRHDQTWVPLARIARSLIQAV